MKLGTEKRRASKRLWRAIGAGASAFALVFAFVAFLALPFVTNGAIPVSTVGQAVVSQATHDDAALPSDAARNAGDGLGASNRDGVNDDGADVAASSANVGANADTSDAANGLSVSNAAESVSTGSSTTVVGTVPSVKDIPDDDLPDITLAHDHETVLVEVKPGITADQFNEAIKRADGIADVQLTQADMEGGIVSMPVADGVDAAHALAQLRHLPEIRYAQPNFEYFLEDDLNQDSAIPNQEPAATDQLLAADGGLAAASPTALAPAETVDDKDAGSQWALKSVHAYEAWDKVKTNKRVTVAVVDNGCLTTHEDLKDNIVAAYNAVDPGSGLTANRHGTHVCGIIAGRANNATGIAGVSYNAGLLPIQVFRGSSATTESLVKAYQYIEDKAELFNIRVVNMSIGAAVEPGTDEDDPDNDDEQDELLVKAVQEAYDKGILTVCSAGNEAAGSSSYSSGNAIPAGPYLNFPSDWLDCALGVIALKDGSPTPVRAAYSNYNMAGQKTKDISAPGSGIHSCYSSSNSSYGTSDGTSMAAPCVSGVAALLFAANPSLSADQVSQILCRTATGLGDGANTDNGHWCEEYGAGEVNAFAAVNGIGTYLDGDSTMLVGDDITMTPSQSGAWEWSSSDTAIATVSDTGVVHGVAGGVVTVSARSGETVVQKDVKVFDISFGDAPADEPYEIEYGSSVDVTFNENPDTGMWYIDTDDNDIAKIELDSQFVRIWGLSRGDAGGTTNVKAELATNEKLAVRHSVKVVPAQIGRMAIALEDTYVRTGESQTPEPTISYNNFCGTGESIILSKGVDYDLAYEGDTVNGPVKVIIEGKGNYAGKVERTISMGSPDMANATIASIPAKTYSGSAFTPKPTVVMYGKALSNGKDYTLSYQDNKDAGTATVTATATGKTVYTGSVSTTFVIAKRNVTLTSTSASKVYDGTPLTAKNVTVSGSRFVSGEVSNIRATGSITNVGSVSNVITFTSSESFKAANYDIVKQEGTLNVTAKSLASATVSGLSWGYTYNGKAKTPSPTLRLGSTTLSKDVDYTLSYKNNKNVGKATVTATGKGNYSGTASATFKITKAANTMKAKAVTKSVKYSKVKKRARVVSGAVKITTRGQGALTYAKVAKGSSAKLTVAKKTGKITVKKGTKKGTYKIKVKVTAAGNANYAACSRTVTVKIRVK